MCNIRWILAALLGWWVLSLGGGCGPMTWKVDNARAHGNVGTQFQISWGTTVGIGFPGTLSLDAEGEMQGEADAKLEDTTDVE